MTALLEEREVLHSSCYSTSLIRRFIASLFIQQTLRGPGLQPARPVLGREGGGAGGRIDA